MTRVTGIVVGIVVLTSCGGNPQAPSATVPVTPLLPVPSAVSNRVDAQRDLAVGESVEEVFGDGGTINPGDHDFYLTPPTNGDLTVTLSWNPKLEGTLLKVTADGQVFRPAAPDWTPVIGRIHVEAGKRYLIAVGLSGADWLPQDPFVLSTRLDP
jgi:hypothetical protein